ncbi:uncharacterized protein LOC144163244 [Haemaphysalis longicornis]
MHAVVRFIDDEDKRLHIVPVDAIVNFKPKDERDFSKSTLYNVYWQDPVEANTGMYRAQVLMLAATKEELDARLASKRLPIPKVHDRDEDSSDEPAVGDPRKDILCLGLKCTNLKVLPQQKEVMVSPLAARKPLTNRKPTLVCKDTAQAIWTAEVLARRSVSGQAAPKSKATGETAKLALTPMKVSVVIDMLRYWGEQKQVDVAAVVPNVPRLLTEKIQDVRKSQKKLSTVARNLASADLASTDLASKDLAPKDLAPKDLAAKDLAPKDLAPKDLAANNSFSD